MQYNSQLGILTDYFQFFIYVTYGALMNYAAHFDRAASWKFEF